MATIALFSHASTFQPLVAMHEHRLLHHDLVSGESPIVIPRGFLFRPQARRVLYVRFKNLLFPLCSAALWCAPIIAALSAIQSARTRWVTFYLGAARFIAPRCPLNPVMELPPSANATWIKSKSKWKSKKLIKSCTSDGGTSLKARVGSCCRYWEITRNVSPSTHARSCATYRHTCICGKNQYARRWGEDEAGKRRRNVEAVA